MLHGASDGNSKPLKLIFIPVCVVINANFPFSYRAGILKRCNKRFYSWILRTKHEVRMKWIFYRKLSYDKLAEMILRNKVLFLWSLFDIRYIWYCITLYKIVGCISTCNHLNSLDFFKRWNQCERLTMSTETTQKKTW